ncbi:DUF4390 domain-containing protein [Oryzomicrobium terrae]|uniref:DUF4390 domain-containing protein n=1 Tax=Oryzomicrobium terrae TaxID=1735038 RepID=UPI003CCC47FB
MLLAILLLGMVPAVAAEIEVRQPVLVAGDDGYAVSADFVFDLPARLEDAVTRGVVLPFVIEFEITRRRWWWLDESVVTRSQTVRLSYHALTRQYRLSVGALHQSFSSLEEALRLLSRLRHWTVLERSQLRSGDPYEAALRLRLDISQLPKPFQISALANRDWTLSSDWARWSFVPASLPSEAR